MTTSIKICICIYLQYPYACACICTQDPSSRLQLLLIGSLSPEVSQVSRYSFYLLSIPHLCTVVPASRRLQTVTWCHVSRHEGIIWGQPARDLRANLGECPYLEQTHTNIFKVIRLHIIDLPANSLLPIPLSIKKIQSWRNMHPTVKALPFFKLINVQCRKRLLFNSLNSNLLSTADIRSACFI